MIIDMVFPRTHLSFYDLNISFKYSKRLDTSTESTNYISKEKSAILQKGEINALENYLPYFNEDLSNSDNVTHNKAYPASSPTGKSTKAPNKEVKDKYPNQTHHDHELLVFPPHLTSQSRGTLLERKRSLIEVVGFVHQNLYSFASFKDLLLQLKDGVYSLEIKNFLKIAGKLPVQCSLS